MKGFRSSGLMHLRMPTTPVGAELLGKNMFSPHSRQVGDCEEDDSSDLEDLPKQECLEMEKATDSVPLLFPKPEVDRMQTHSGELDHGTSGEQISSVPCDKQPDQDEMLFDKTIGFDDSNSSDVSIKESFDNSELISETASVIDQPLLGDLLLEKVSKEGELILGESVATNLRTSPFTSQISESQRTIERALAVHQSIVEQQCPVSVGDTIQKEKSSLLDQSIAGDIHLEGPVTEMDENDELRPLYGFSVEAPAEDSASIQRESQVDTSADMDHSVEDTIPHKKAIDANKFPGELLKSSLQSTLGYSFPENEIDRVEKCHEVRRNPARILQHEELVRGDDDNPKENVQVYQSSREDFEEEMEINERLVVSYLPMDRFPESALPQVPEFAANECLFNFSSTGRASPTQASLVEKKVDHQRIVQEDDARSRSDLANLQQKQHFKDVRVFQSTGRGSIEENDVDFRLIDNVITVDQSGDEASPRRPVDDATERHKLPLRDNSLDKENESKEIKLEKRGTVHHYIEKGVPEVKGVEDETHLVEKAIELLKAFAPNTPDRNDVVLALTLFYQKRGILRLSHCFTEHKSSNNAFWTSFVCPLDGVEYTSGIPVPLLRNRGLHHDELHQAAAKIFGNFKVQKDQVVFSTKKGAKRAVAFAVLEAHQATGVETALIASRIENDEISHDLGLEECHKHDFRSFPEWVHELHGVGVRAESLEITYRQHFLSRKVFSRCELCCILQVNKPRQITVISLPCSSKHSAIVNGVNLLTEELKRTGSESPTPPCLSALTRIHKCDPSNAVYLSALPQWANGLFSGKLYLYRLHFLTLVGTDFVASRSGLDLDVLTPLGIAFTSPLPDSLAGDRSFQAYFELPNAIKTSAERAIVKISNPVVVDLTSDNDKNQCRYSVHECLFYMTSLNEMICSWKQYGLGKFTQRVKVLDCQVTNPNDRTYMFVPLRSNEASTPCIDWHLLRQISNAENTPLLKLANRDWVISFMAKVYLLLALNSLLWFLRFFFLGSNALGSMFLVVTSITAYLAYKDYADNPPRLVANRTLQNRFMLEVKPGLRRLIVTPSKDYCQNPLQLIESRLSGLSYVLNPNVKRLSGSFVEANRKKSRLNMMTETFESLYKKKFGIKLRYPRLRLIHGVPLAKHAEQDFLFLSKRERFRRLIPELVVILPCPRDLLYMLKHAKNFMPALEEAITSIGMASEIHDFFCRQSAEVSLPNPRSEVSSLAKVLDEALTIGKHQRLEFLGDAVLGYVVAINLMARNSSLAWDADDLGMMIQDACKNSTLYEAALRLGIGSHLRARGGIWSSVFQSSGAVPISTTLIMIHNITCSRASDYLAIESNDKALSDVVESLLGAAFLFGLSSDQKLLIGLFEGMSLPLSGKQSIPSDHSLPWFRCTSPCLSEGYIFDNDASWKEQIKVVGTSSCSENAVSAKLENGLQGLVSLFASLSNEDSLKLKLASPQAKVLLMSALFDDSLRESETDVLSMVEVIAHGGHETGLLGAAMLRDTLGMVGNNSLKLSVTNELFQRYPDADQSGLHVLRACATADDVVVYIMFKAGIHKFLFDQGAECLSKFESMMEISDGLGKEEWSNRNGWILPGGDSEYAARTRLPRGNGAAAKPKYYGLAGGRLVGRNQKLPETITSDLSFSMKTIIGALVLLIGVDGMWNAVGPMFDEVMLLSIDELRQEYPNSSIIR